MSPEQFLALVRRFIPWHNGADLVWGFWLRVGRSWSWVAVRCYRGTYFINGIDAKASDPASGELLRAWTGALRLWMAAAARDPVGAQAATLRRLPLSLRRGVLLRSSAKALLPDWLPFERESGSKERKSILRILDRQDPGPIPEMTAERYFKYCREAYQANPRTFRDRGFKRGSTGKDYYKRYADGRDGGLSALDARSTQAFRNWFDSGERAGAHPWEIYRGGNSTHIGMSPTASACAGSPRPIPAEAGS